MSDIDKWYPFYPTDYLKDTMCLTDSEDLLYRRLLDFYWINGGKFDEKTQKNLPKILRFSREKYAKNWRKIREFFPLIDGYYTNARMDAELLKAANRAESARQNGKKGGRPKKNPEVSVSLTQTITHEKAQKGDGGPYQGSDIPISNTIGGNVIRPDFVDWES